MKKSIDSLKVVFSNNEILSIRQQTQLRGGGDGEDLRRPPCDGANRMAGPTTTTTGTKMDSTVVTPKG